MSGWWHCTLRWWRRFAKDSRAVAATEYAVLLTLIAVAVFGAAAMLGRGVRTGMHSISAGLSDTGDASHGTVVHTGPGTHVNVAYDDRS